MNSRGLTLLETMVALVIVGVIVSGTLGAVVQSGQAVGKAATWSDAVAYAEDGLERTRAGETLPDSTSAQPLAGGYLRWVERAPRGGVLRQLTVVVRLPGGARFALSVLEPER